MDFCFKFHKTRDNIILIEKKFVKIVIIAISEITADHVKSVFDTGSDSMDLLLRLLRGCVKECKEILNKLKFILNSLASQTYQLYLKQNHIEIL